MHEHQPAFEVLGKVWVLINVVSEGGIVLVADDFLYTMVLLAPPPVVDAVVVVASVAHGHFEEIWINQHGCSAHEAAAAMAMDAHFADINVWEAVCQLFCC